MLAGGDIPQTVGLIVGSSDEGSPIGGKGNRRRERLVSRQDGFGSGSEIPKMGRLALRARSQEVTVRTERDG